MSELTREPVKRTDAGAHLSASAHCAIPWQRTIMTRAVEDRILHGQPHLDVNSDVPRDVAEVIHCRISTIGRRDHVPRRIVGDLQRAQPRGSADKPRTLTILDGRRKRGRSAESKTRPESVGTEQMGKAKNRDSGENVADPSGEA